MVPTFISMIEITHLPHSGLTPDAPLRLVMETFASVVHSWTLDDAEVDAILFAPIGTWAVFHPRPGGRLPLPHCERRVLMIIEIDEMLKALLTCGATPAEWLRHPRRQDHGRTPLSAMARAIGVLPALRSLLRREYDQENAGEVG